MSSKYQLKPGYSWCEKCQGGVPGEFCTKHQLDRPITLNRYDAKVLYDLAISLGIEPASYIPEQKDVIHDLIEGLEQGRFTIVPLTLGPNGFKTGEAANDTA